MKHELNKIASFADLPIQINSKWSEKNLLRELKLASLSVSTFDSYRASHNLNDILEAISLKLKDVPSVLKDPHILFIEDFERFPMNLQVPIMERLIDLGKTRNIKTIITVTNPENISSEANDRTFHYNVPALDTTVNQINEMRIQSTLTAPNKPK